MVETKINATLSSKFKKTQVNSVQKLPDITGLTLDEFNVDSRLDIISGEADIYLCSGSGNFAGKKFLLKYYRRENAVKPDVLEKLKAVNSPFVAPVEGYGEYQGHQYVVRPYYEMSALSELLAGGTRFSEEELKSLIIPSIIEGLKAVHDAGILHKDLKPANLIPDDAGEHIVLIDFGISSDAGNNTFVVTQTGMTPFYAAPEALQGIFHRETDYYALGITVFELFTGFTPFQNPRLSPEEVAKLAFISKIEFPEGFPEDLKKLVLGLTYKDISHRNELNNPNRRWGYDEVSRWLNEEAVPIPGENDSIGQSQKFLPYSFCGVKYQSLGELVKALLKNPKAGIREIGRGILAHHFSLFDPVGEKLCREAEDNLQKNTDSVFSFKIFYRLMYTLSPEIKSLFCGGLEFANLTELGGAAVVNAASGNSKFCKEFELLQRAFLGFYVVSVIKNVTASNLISKADEQIARNRYSDFQIAWILGYALSEKRNIRVGDTAFSCPAEFFGYLRKMEADKGFSGYIKYIEDNHQDLEFFAACIPEEKTRQALRLVLEDLNRAIFGNGEFQFKNAKAFDDYVGKLFREKKTYHLYHILNTYDAALREVSEKIWKSSSHENLRRTVSGFIRFAEFIFPTELDLKDYLEKLFQENKDTPEFFRNFVSYHNASLTELERRSGLSQVISKFRSYGSANPKIQGDITVKGITYPSLQPLKLKIGEYFRFGNYPQNSAGSTSPIEWLVLEVNGNEAFIISRYGLDCHQYHYAEYKEITWEQCDLRNWLNNDFLKAAFSKEEQKRIILSEVVNESNQRYGTKGGNNTWDRVFCLSIAEARKYFDYDYARRCGSTILTKTSGAYSGTGGVCWWWLRSPGYNQFDASFVNTLGVLNLTGHNAVRKNGTVRPALRLLLS
ncbi:protein kinase domain-containing protein [Succinimonas amylolytica]|uniref:protein kinase domain-containing protein n=1 Tax=Succinimonas amylolytica TaxID=83769 RepID=UPI00038100CC|nr:DUF6273 domain-containing protein [Succinimonas amylolytica]